MQKHLSRFFFGNRIYPAEIYSVFSTSLLEAQTTFCMKKSYLILLLVLLVAGLRGLTSCDRETVYPMGHGSWTPGLSKNLLSFDETGGTDTLSVNRSDFTFNAVGENGSGPGIPKPNSMTDTVYTIPNSLYTVYAKKGRVYKITGSWFSVIQTLDNGGNPTKGITVKVSPMGNDTTRKEATIILFGKSNASPLVIQQIAGMNRVAVSQAENTALNYASSLIKNQGAGTYATTNTPLNISN